MGQSGFVNGSVYAQNLQSGSVSKTLGGTGSDTVTVTFGKYFKKTPTIVTQCTSDIAVTIRVTAKSVNGFTAKIISSNLTAAMTFDYQASDLTYY